MYDISLTTMVTQCKFLSGNPVEERQKPEYDYSSNSKW